MISLKAIDVLKLNYFRGRIISNKELPIFVGIFNSMLIYVNFTPHLVLDRPSRKHVPLVYIILRATTFNFRLFSGMETHFRGLTDGLM